MKHARTYSTETTARPDFDFVCVTPQQKPFFHNPRVERVERETGGK